ncbi:MULTISPECIES: hypothetical protein [unclassified Streptomyces]|uniref:hypothetical protein n=1 Tax=unclassified Streptomyces TaxID=2593676 RepID=UPI0033276F7B
MASELQRRLIERRERQELDRMLRTAPEVITAHPLALAEVPDGALNAVRGFWSMSTEPLATLNDEAGDQCLGSWVEELLARHSFHTTAFLLTGLDLAPWIEFRMPPGWFTSIRQAKDSAWVFLRADLGAVAAVSEQEYRFEFFVSHLT